MSPARTVIEFRHKPPPKRKYASASENSVTVTGILGRNNTKRMSITTVELPGGRVISPVRSLRKTNAELNEPGNSTSDKAFTSVATGISPGRYELDEKHAYLSFSYSHMGLSNPRLHFSDFDAELELDGNNMAKSNVRIAVDAASIESGRGLSVVVD